MTLAILHDAGGVLAISKPAGLPTQAPPGIESVESLVRRRLFGDAAAAARAAGRRRHPGGFLGLPHRLDRSVSGILLLATTPRAARQLARQFERRQVRKTYLAVVSAAGVDPPAAGLTFEWRDTIRKVPGEPRAEIVPPGSAGGREAVTAGRVRAAGPDLVFIELEPVTGRMHQLRLQAASRGLPVLGDVLYGGPPGEGWPAADGRTRPIALHAWQIVFTDPASGAATRIVCPPGAGEPWRRFPEPAIHGESFAHQCD